MTKVSAHRPLSDILLSQHRKHHVFRDIELLLDVEITKIKGIKGHFIKHVYRQLKERKTTENHIQASYLYHLIDYILPRFANALDPIAAQAQDSPQGTEAFLNSSQELICADLLTVTDYEARTYASRFPSLQYIYRILRPSAHAYVSEAMPNIIALLYSYLSNSDKPVL